MVLKRLVARVVARRLKRWIDEVTPLFYVSVSGVVLMNSESFSLVLCLLLC